MTARGLLATALLAAAAPAFADTAPALYEDAVPERASVADRLEEVRRRVQAALEYPPLARHRAVTGETVLRFAIGADRRARDVTIVRSSGQPLLDRAAVRAVGAAGELPRLYGPLEIPVRFEID
jgi:TonB family protein